MRAWVLAVVLGAAPSAWASDPARLVLLRLHRVATDYARVVPGDGGAVSTVAWEAQRTSLRDATQAYRRLVPDGGLEADFASLVAAVDARAPPSVVAEAADLLARRVGREQRVARYPLLWPGFEGAARTWAERCASCHGDAGAGDGPAARALRPPPPDLSATGWADHRSPLHLYDVITQGIPGTAMPGFEAELGGVAGWSLAFWLLTLAPARGLAPDGGPWIGLSELTERSTAQLAQRATLEHGLSEGEASRWADALRRGAPPLLSVPRAMDCLAQGAQVARELSGGLDGVVHAMHVMSLKACLQ